MKNFFKNKYILIIKFIFLALFLTNLSYARDEFSPITWTHLLPEDVFDFIPAGGVKDEMWKDSEFLQKLRNSRLVTVDELEGTKVKITGFMVPLEVDYDQIETVSEFVLVPSAGMCIHVPPPPPNQMVLVQLEDPVKVRSMYQPIGISGKISIKSPNADAYDSVYIMHVEKVEDVTFDDLDLGR
mgnify:FL=1